MSSSRDRLEPAFRPLRPVEASARLAGRKVALRRLVGALDEQSHTLMFGEQGVGKTSMLRIVAALARDAGHLAIDVHCSSDLGFDELIRHVTGSIPLLYHKDHSPLAGGDRTGRSFADLLSDAPISVAAAGRLLANVTGVRVLILLDSFDRISEPGLSSKLGELMNTLSDANAGVQFVISGTAAEACDLVEDDVLQMRALVVLTLPRLEDADVFRLVQDRSMEAEVEFAPAAISLIVDMAKGLPSLAGLLSYHAAIAGRAASGSPVSPSDVEDAIATLTARAGCRVTKRARHLVETHLDSNLLAALGHFTVDAGQSSFSLDRIRLRQTFGDPEAERIEAEIASLAGRKILIEGIEPRAYAFLERGLSHYLQYRSALVELQTSDGGAQLLNSAIDRIRPSGV